MFVRANIKASSRDPISSGTTLLQTGKRKLINFTDNSSTSRCNVTYYIYIVYSTLSEQCVRFFKYIQTFHIKVWQTQCRYGWIRGQTSPS